MFRLLLVFPLCLAVATAFAVDPDPTNHLSQAKGSAHVLQNPGVPDAREGGETIEDAVPIFSLPFSDTGNTCDNINDYDEACPYTGSIAPDVVYAYTAPADMLVDIDLCASQYDTKVFVYCESPGNLTACNDDACANEWTPYASRLDAVPLFAGFTYYVVVDGYGADCGYYVLEIMESIVCTVECPPFGVPEGEPPLADYYEDHYNGGCGSIPPIFQPVWALDGDCATICGRSGWYWNNGDFRDTDWFEVVTTADEINFTAVGEYPIMMLVLQPNCDDLVILHILQLGPCEEGTITFDTLPYQLYWLWIGPQTFTGPVMEFDYVMTVCGILDNVIPTESASWGAVKSLYR